MPNILTRIRNFNKRRNTSRSLDEADRQLIEKIRADRLTYLSIPRLESLAAAVREIESASRAGILVEAGCALGGSAILLGSLKNPRRELRVYDVFGMIPPPTADDPVDVHERYQAIVSGQSAGIDGDQYYGYADNLYDIVENNFRRYDVEPNAHSVALIKGLVQDTLNIDEPVALAHVDVDWYEPVTTCLQRIFPRLVQGGSIILDDYKDWGGCRKAADEFLASVPGQFSLDDAAGSMRITRL